MKNLPVVSGKDLIKALRKYGFWVERQKGAHVRLKYKSIDKTVKLTIPLHDPLKKGTLNRILKDAGISVEELRSLMKR
jgi:predicted RNA binding protein YcfA (HicA-like mRNA interferase family)